MEWHATNRGLLPVASRRLPALWFVVTCLILLVPAGRADEPAAAPALPAFRSVPGVPDLYVLSVAYGDPRTVRQFVARGDKVDAPGPNGFTPFMAAALTADVEMLHALLEAGADIRAKHSSGASVLDLAQVADWRVVHQLLTHDAGQVLNGTVSLLHTAGLPGRRQDAVRLLKDRGAAPGSGVEALVGDLPVLAEAPVPIRHPDEAGGNAPGNGGEASVPDILVLTEPPVRFQDLQANQSEMVDVLTGGQEPNRSAESARQQAIKRFNAGCVEPARRRALIWLTSAQNSDGSWGEYDRTGTSALAMLAYLDGGGYGVAELNASTGRGLKWWVDAAGDSARVPWEGSRTETCARIALLFSVTYTPLCWPGESPSLVALLARQHADGGFGYSFDGPNWNLWDTAWAIVALKAAYWRTTGHHDDGTASAIVEALRKAVPFVSNTAVMEGAYRYSTAARETNMDIIGVDLRRSLGLQPTARMGLDIDEGLRKGPVPQLDWSKAPERVLPLRFEFGARFRTWDRASWKSFWNTVVFPLLMGQCSDGSINPFQSYPQALCTPDDRIRATALAVIGTHDRYRFPEYWRPMPWLQPPGTPQPHSGYGKKRRPLEGVDVELEQETK